MSETIQVGNTADLICDLKAAVTALECQYKKNLEDHAHKQEKKCRQPPMFVMIPLEQKTNSDDGTTYEDKIRHKGKNRHDYGTEEHADIVGRSHHRKTGVHRNDECEETNGPRLRGGVLHGRCGCIHRDGLQDSCPLTDCQGQPACMTKPWATCPPARYFRARFPDNWPSATDSITF